MLSSFPTAIPQEDVTISLLYDLQIVYEYWQKEDSFFLRRDSVKFVPSEVDQPGLLIGRYIRANSGYLDARTFTIYQTTDCCSEAGYDGIVIRIISTMPFLIDCQQAEWFLEMFKRYVAHASNYPEFVSIAREAEDEVFDELEKLVLSIAEGGFQALADLLIDLK